MSSTSAKTAAESESTAAKEWPLGFRIMPFESFARLCFQENRRNATFWFTSEDRLMHARTPLGEGRVFERSCRLADQFGFIELESCGEFGARQRWIGDRDVIEEMAEVYARHCAIHEEMTDLFTGISEAARMGSRMIDAAGRRVPV